VSIAPTLSLLALVLAAAGLAGALCSPRPVVAARVRGTA
jgi:hypothetical protein